MFKAIVYSLMIGLAATHASEPITLEYWEKWSGEEGEAMVQIVNDFNASQDGIHVNFSTVSQIDQKLLLSVLGKNPPDLAGLWASFVAPYADRGLINPLTSLIDQSVLSMSAFAPTYAEMCQHRGEVWAIPSSAMSLMLYLNERILSESGIGADFAPDSLDHLQIVGRRLTLVELERGGETTVIPFDKLTKHELDNNSYEIVRLGFDPTVAQVWLPYLARWFGNDLIVGENGAINYRATSLRNCLKWYNDFFETYGLAQIRAFGSSYGGFSSASNPFFSDRVAIIINGPWLPKFAEEYAPGLRWTVAPIPSAISENKNTVTLTDTDILVIPRGAKHPEAAFQFLEYLSQPKVSEKLNLLQCKMTPLAQPTAQFSKEHLNPDIDKFYATAGKESAFPVHKSVVFSRLVSDLYTAFDIASVSLEDSYAFLDRAQEAISKRVNKANKKWDIRGDAFRNRGNVR